MSCRRWSSGVSRTSGGTGAGRPSSSRCTNVSQHSLVWRRVPVATSSAYTSTVTDIDVRPTWTTRRAHLHEFADADRLLEEHPVDGQRGRLPAAVSDGAQRGATVHEAHDDAAEHRRCRSPLAWCGIMRSARMASEWRGVRGGIVCSQRRSQMRVYKRVETSVGSFPSLLPSSAAPCARSSVFRRLPCLHRCLRSPPRTSSTISRRLSFCVGVSSPLAVVHSWPSKAEILDLRVLRELLVDPLQSPRAINSRAASSSTNSASDAGNGPCRLRCLEPRTHRGEIRHDQRAGKFPVFADDHRLRDERRFLELVLRGLRRDVLAAARLEDFLLAVGDAQETSCRCRPRRTRPRRPCAGNPSASTPSAVRSGRW